jgi:hypothetical protein
MISDCIIDDVVLAWHSICGTLTAKYKDWLVC